MKKSKKKKMISGQKRRKGMVKKRTKNGHLGLRLGGEYRLKGTEKKKRRRRIVIVVKRRKRIGQLVLKRQEEYSLKERIKEDKKMSKRR